MILFSKRFMLFALTLVLMADVSTDAQDRWDADKLWAAAQQGNLKNVKAAIEAGVEVDAKNRYGATALFFACDRGNLEIVNYLLEKGASPNVKDTFYQATPVSWAQQKGHQAIVGQLLKAGALGVDGFLLSAIAKKDAQLARLAVESGNVNPLVLHKAKQMAEKKEDPELLAIFDGVEIPETSPVQLSQQALRKLTGNYNSARVKAVVSLQDEQLMLKLNTGAETPLEAIGKHQFLLNNSPLTFAMQDDAVASLTISFAGNDMELKPTASEVTPPTEQPDPAEPKDPEPKPFTKSSEESLAADRAISSANWPSFRGHGARGVGEGQDPPSQWDVPAKENLLWKTDIPGLGLSCPAIWGDQIFITTAVNEEADTNVKIGLYGNVDSVEEDFVYQFKVICVDKQTGKIIWEQTANEAKPAVKRHAKSSHANPTVATDGKHVIAFFGSEGIYCYSMDGKLEWKKSFGLLDSGWFYDAGYQWGFGSSPVIHEGKVIIQCDIQKDSFVAALDVENGDEIWRIKRDEIPTWSSPIVHDFGETAMLITHGTNAARGYDARTGELLWTLPKHSEIVVPTPFVAHGMIYVASGYSPIQPIYAIRPSARGDIRLKEKASENQYIAWSHQRGGPYMPSPIVYGDYMYCCSNRGILTCYHAKTGTRVYRQRLKAAGAGVLSFTASPIAADGKIYLPAEDGRVLVIQSGPEFKLLETNPVGENILATPAISDGKIILRSQESLMAVGK